MSLTCFLCSRVQKFKKKQYTTVKSVAVAYNTKEAFQEIKGISLSTSILNKKAHTQWYGKYVHHHAYLSKKKTIIS
jgi:AAA+ superfamily predicted ATPase